MHPGDLIADRFEIVALAGAGGMGEVWKARDHVSGEVVAVKVLRAAGGDPERFAREAMVLAELRHPGVVAYVAHGAQPDGSRYLAMEWLDGEDLEVRLRRARLAPHDVVELVVRVAEVLGAAHARGVVHRDVKPSNLFLVEGRVDRTKLLDFGVAQARGRLAVRAVTHTGAAMGTPGYMAPEQAKGERDLDARADVFSLGCVLFECLTGAPAFAGDHAIAILAKILLEEAPRLDAILPAVPPELADLCAAMLAKEREERPRDGGDVTRALRAMSALPSLRPGPREAPPPALTTDELRLVSVVLSTDAAAAVDTDARTLAAAEHPGADGLRAVAAERGERAQRLVDGTVVCVLSGVGATERAARLALAFAAVGGGVGRVALATGRAQVEGPLPVGDAIDRAVALTRGPAAPVAIDAMSAALLGPSFEVSGSLLLAERAREEVARTLLGRSTPCVGRDRELRALRDYWAECVEESMARPVLVTAPAGVGKSRLAHELVNALRREGSAAQIWIGRGDPTRAGSPLSLVRQALQATMGTQQGEPVESVRAKVRARVARHVPAAQREHVTLFLGELVGARFPDDESPPLRTARAEAIVMADNTRRAWEDFMIAECSASPMLLVLEDLHWGDGATVSYTDSALRNLGERPCMVLALARPEVHDLFPRLFAERGLQEVRLDGLSRKASERIVREALGGGVSQADVAAVVERAAGNAFFLEELVRAIAEGKDGGVPESVLAVVEQRLVALDPEARRVLRAASVLGTTFWEGAVRALLGDRDPGPWLAVLADAELVHAREGSRVRGERELAFRHEVVRAAAYAMLTPEDRALGHVLAAEWLERAGEQDARIVAEHLEKGGERARAAGWYLRAAEQALDGNELGDALARAERGILCGAAGALLGELNLVQAVVDAWAGRVADAARRARAAMDLLPPNEARWFEALATALRSSQKAGRREEVLALTTMLEGATPRAGAEVDRARALWTAALHLGFFGERQRQRAVAELAAEAHDDRVAGTRHMYEALRANTAGDAARYAREFELAHAAFVRTGDRRRACSTLVNLGFARTLLGDHARAVPMLRESLDVSRRMGLQGVESGALHNLGLALWRAGRLEEARAVEEQAALAYRRHGDPRMEGCSRLYLAEIFHAAGDLAAARREGRAALDLLAVAPPWRPYALAVLARVDLASGDLAAARAGVEEAMRGVEGAEEGESTIRLVYAEVIEACGEARAARAAIEAARDRLLARAAQITDADDRARFLGGIPEHARTLLRAGASPRDEQGAP